MTLNVTLNKYELNSLKYPIVVEMWDKVKSSGSKRKKYNETFTEKERVVIAKYHTVFHRWYLVDGTPDEKTMSLETLTLLKKAIDFFANL